MQRVPQMSFTGWRTRDVMDWFDEDAITFDQAKEMLSVNEGEVKNCPECGEFVPGEPEQRWHMEFKHPHVIGERLREARMGTPVRPEEHIHDWRYGKPNGSLADNRDGEWWHCQLCGQAIRCNNPINLPRPNFRSGDFDPSIVNASALPPPREMDYEHARKSLEEWAQDETE